MLRRCMDCQCVYGVRCPRCATNREPVQMPDGLYICHDCKHVFPANEGHDTHGLCPTHQETRRLEVQLYKQKLAEQRRSAR